MEILPMHSTGEIKEKIRQRYRQPKGVERFGIEPVPPELKTVRGHDIFSIIFGFALNPGSMLVGGMAVASGLSFLGAVGAITGGVLLATISYTIMATLGVDYGLPGQVATRMVYGLRGAKWVPSFLRTIASTYWFAYQTVAGSLAVVAILDRWTGTPHSLVMVSITFAVLQAVVAIIGYDSLKHLSRIALPFKILILSYVILLMATSGNPGFSPTEVLSYPGKPDANWLLFVTWMNVVAAGSLTMVTDAADFCRYTRSRADMWWGTLLGKVGGGCFAALLGAYGAAATLGKTANVFEVVFRARHQLDLLTAVSGRHCARQFDDQCPQPLYGRTVALEHVRTPRSLVDDGHH
jgi:NCS1 nucleoside transporter family